MWWHDRVMTPSFFFSLLPLAELSSDKRSFSVSFFFLLLSPLPRQMTQTSNKVKKGGRGRVRKGREEEREEA